MDSRTPPDSNGSHYFKYVCSCSCCSLRGSMELIWFNNL